MKREKIEQKKEEGVNFEIDGNCFFSIGTTFPCFLLTVSARLFDMVCEADSMFLSHIAANI
jgi:hypothetical protein